VGLQRAAARPAQRGLPIVGNQAPNDPWRVVLADDARAWSDGDEQGNLSRLSTAGRLAALERLTEDGAGLVVICGHRQALQVNRGAALARSMLDARVAVVALPGGPLGQFAMARIAEQALAVGARPAALIISMLPRLAASLVDVGLVGSVSALDVPGIKLGQHVASYLPGSRLFAVQLTPAPFVATMHARGVIGAAVSEFQTAHFGVAGARLLTAGPREVPAELAELWGVSGQAHPVTSLPQLAQYWRDEQASEFVVVPADPATWVTEQVPAMASLPCRWCGEPLAEPMPGCIFCGNTRR
jgi:hypothetical protein